MPKPTHSGARANCIAARTMSRMSSSAPTSSSTCATWYRSSTKCSAVAQVDGTSVAQAAASFGFSRPLFYHAQEAFQEAGLPGLIRKRPGPRHAHKLTDEVIAFIERLRADDETADSASIAEKLRQKFQLTVHPRSIERALNRKRKKGRQR